MNTRTTLSDPIDEAYKEARALIVDNENILKKAQDGINRLRKAGYRCDDLQRKLNKRQRENDKLKSVL